MADFGGLLGSIGGGVGGYYGAGALGVVNPWYLGASAVGGAILGNSLLGNGGGSGGYQVSNPPYSPPVYTTIADSSGNLPANYTIQNPLSSQPNYLTQYADRATGLNNLTDPWIGLQRQQIASAQSQGTDAAKQSIAGQIQQAYEQLASRGGARSGARENLATAGQGQMFQAIQQLGRQASDQNRQVDLNAMQAGLGIQAQLPGLQVQRGQFDASVQQNNIANMLAERARAYQAQQDIYNTQMTTWAAQQQAQATAKSAGGGGPLGGIGDMAGGILGGVTNVVSDVVSSVGDIFDW